VLLRGLQALENPPAADLSDSSVLVLSGHGDPYAHNADELATALRAHGARVDLRELPAGHELTGADVTEAAEWLQRNLPLR
jgi:phospholipase/carboxylesterase